MPPGGADARCEQGWASSQLWCPPLLVLQRFPPAGATMAEVLKPLTGEAEAPATAALELVVVEKGPVLGAAEVGGVAGGDSGEVAGPEGHSTGTHGVRMY